MELNAEDALRLNVMLANALQAVRIDESSMTVHALSEQGEASIRLNPSGRDDQYLKAVRELLSSQVLGSPGGYPVFLRRWTRMGQARDDSLEQLLLLGEPEAVVAVVHASGLNDEIARKAWWAMPEADNARRMLENESVVSGSMGKVLAEYLVEYLPFETEHRAMLETVRLVLQPGLISDELRDKLWRSAKRRNSYYVGFMDAIPDALPEAGAARKDWPGLEPRLRPLAQEGNPVAAQLCRCLGERGQVFLKTAQIVTGKPNNQEVVVELLKSIQRYFSGVCPNSDPAADMDTILADAEALLDVPAVCATTEAVQEVLAVAPECRDDIRALLTLAWAGEPLVNPIFARSDAIGSVMRKKIAPVTGPLLEQIARLRGMAGSQ
ncbi:MAG TPA: sulfur reduction protein DsrS [Gammaproteobacteria bacterium]|nr:sulfur reduction protein DsrS [Gammaproteobacteria bacterium]